MDHILTMMDHVQTMDVLFQTMMDHIQTMDVPCVNNGWIIFKSWMDHV